MTQEEKVTYKNRLYVIQKDTNDSSDIRNKSTRNMR